LLRTDGGSIVAIGGTGELADDGITVLRPQYNFHPPTFNDLGEVAFSSLNLRLDEGPPRQGLMLSRLGATARTVEAGMEWDEGTWTFFRTPRLNSSGQIVFPGQFITEDGQLVSGVFRVTDGEVEAISQSGDLDPQGRGRLMSFDPLHLAINDRGQLAFGASTEEGSGLFFYDDQMGLQTVVQVGDEIEGRVVDRVFASLPGYQSNLFDSGFNQFGQVAFAFRTADRRTGSAIWSPYPRGDFTANGIVDQADLDLIFLQWGSSFDDLLSAWKSNPPGATVDQRELDQALLGWGSSIVVTSSPSVPEPAALRIVSWMVSLSVSWKLSRRLLRSA
jgi:hypothetical protein